MERKKTILIAADAVLGNEKHQSDGESMYQVIEVNSKEEAGKALKSMPVDLMILDVAAPGLSGMEILKHRQSNPKLMKIPALVITGPDQEEFESQALSLGADDLLCRPFDARLLHRKIKNLLRSGEADVLLEENKTLRKLRHLESRLMDIMGEPQEHVRMFYALLNYIPSGVAIFDLTDGNAKVIYANRSVCELFGYKQDEYLELIFGEAFFGVHPDELDNIRRELERAIATDTDFKWSFRNQKKNGEYIWVTLQISVEKGENRIMGYGAYMDIGVLKERAEKDFVTGIYNRQAFKELVTLELKKKAPERLTLLFIDLDNFKSINDTFGHTCGDEILREAARRIQMVFRGEDIVARVGGDEYCVFITRAMPVEKVVARTEQLAKKLDIDVEREGKSVHLSASIGIAYSDEYGMNYDRLYKAADVAQYYAKHHGKNCYCIAGQENVLYQNGVRKKD